MLSAAVAIDGRYSHRYFATHRTNEKPSGRDERHERRRMHSTLSQLVAQQGRHSAGNQRR